MSIPCSRCEALNPPDAKFCNNCGHQLKIGQAQSSIPSSSTRPSSIPEKIQSPSSSARPSRSPESSATSGSPNVNPVGAGWSPAKPPPVEEKPYSRALAMLGNILEGGSTQGRPRGKVVGEARNVSARNETDTSGKPWMVLTFRVESFDKAGNRMQPIAVEMRGKSFQGMLNEGDKVRIQSQWREGQILRVSEVYNVTTGSRVKAKKSAPGTPMWIWNIVFFAVIALGLAYCSGAFE